MNVVVTGASRGLGQEFARQFRDRGDRVFAACRKPKEGEMELDVASPESIARFTTDLAERTDRVDLLLHNAGIPHSGQWEESEGFGTLKLEGLEAVLRTNCLGPLLLTQALLPLLERAERPLVAGVSSLFSSLARRDPFFADNFGYSMSKVSLNMWLRSLAILRRKEGLRTVALDPGWVRTDMGGPHAPLESTEVVAGCLRVLDDLTAEQSGTYLAHDGSTVPW